MKAALRWIVAFPTAGAAIYLTGLTRPVLGEIPFIWIAFASLLMMNFCGIGPALIVAGIGLPVVEYHFVPPADAWGKYSVYHILSIFILIVMGCGLRFKFDRARHLIEKQETMINVAAHELRGPLAGALMAVHVQKMGGPVRTDVLEMTLRKVSNLIDDLFDLAKMKHHRLSTERFNLTTDMRALIQMYCPNAALVASDIEIEANRSAIEHIFSNLLSNAKKYGDSKPVVVKITALTKKVRVVVQDSGIGMDPASLKKMFDPYSRFDVDDTRPGLGLGLWIVAENVRLLGGRIEVTSAPGRGTSITVALPRS